MKLPCLTYLPWYLHSTAHLPTPNAPKSPPLPTPSFLCHTHPFFLLLLASRIFFHIFFSRLPSLSSSHGFSRLAFLNLALSSIPVVESNFAHVRAALGTCRRIARPLFASKRQTRRCRNRFTFHGRSEKQKKRSSSSSLARERDRPLIHFWIACNSPASSPPHARPLPPPLPCSLPSQGSLQRSVRLGSTSPHLLGQSSNINRPPIPTGAFAPRHRLFSDSAALSCSNSSPRGHAQS